MKNLFKNIVMTLVAAGLVSSCSDYVGGDVNVSPNSPTDAPVNSIITSAQTNLLGLFEGEDARMAGMWTQQFTGYERQYLSYEEYVVSSEVFSWFQDYIGVIQPCNDAMERLDGEPGVESTVGMLKVMKAMIFGNLTALYGDIPFSQASQPDEYPTPVYDNQVAVYQGIQDMLDEAIADLNAGTASIPNVDILGNRSRDNWLKIAYTLKARFALHTGDYSGAVTYAQNGLQPGDYGLVGMHGNVNQGNDNLWWNFIEFSRSGYLTAFNGHAPRLLDSDEAVYRGDAKTDESARFAFYYKGDAPGNYLANTDDGKMFGKESSFPVLTGVENQLILAEASLKIGSPNETNALNALNSVRAFHATTFAGGTYDAYLITDFDVAGMAYNGVSRISSLLDEIMEEKYLSLIGTIETFNDFRRWNNPFGLTARGTGGQFPERFLIPTSEVNTNPNTPNPIPGLFTPTSVNQ